MLNRSKWFILFSTLSLLIIPPGTCFAWHDYGQYDGSYWYYHGSGRDNPYSDYIDTYYSPGYADYPTPPVSPASIQQITQLNAAPVSQPDQFIVNIPNHHGGYTAIVIKRSGYGYTGPQGEYYPEFPKIFQLEIIYGK